VAESRVEGSRYAFRRRSWRALAGLFDRCGAALVRRAAPAIPLGPAPRVLVLRLDHLGDVLFATPALRALRAGLPGAHVTLAVGPWAAPLVAAGELVDAVHVFAAPWFARPPRRGVVGPGLEFARWVRAGHFDVGIDLRGDVRHLACMAWAGVPVRLGYGRTGGGFWITHPVTYRAAHEVERNLDLVRVLVPGAAPGALASPPVSAGDAAWASVVVRELGLDARRPLVLVHPGAGYPSKRWEAAALAQTLTLAVRAADLHVVLVGGTDDKEAARVLAAQLERAPASLVGRTTLGQLGALLQHATVFVGHDSGPAHLAVAHGVRCVLLYSGVNDIAQWGPWRGHVQVFRTPVPCSPCGLSVCNRAHECMRDLAPAEVASAIVSAVRAAWEGGA
jgi:ADP-heptose:LPS heptosyltransferase